LQLIDESFLEPSGYCGSSVSYELRNKAGSLVVSPKYLTLKDNELTLASSDFLDKKTYKHKIKAFLTDCPEVSVLTEVF
jgi:hypothetical protein